MLFVSLRLGLHEVCTCRCHSSLFFNKDLESDSLWIEVWSFTQPSRFLCMIRVIVLLENKSYTIMLMDFSALNTFLFPSPDL